MLNSLDMPSARTFSSIQGGGVEHKFVVCFAVCQSGDFERAMLCGAEGGMNTSSHLLGQFHIVSTCLCQWELSTNIHVFLGGMFIITGLSFAYQFLFAEVKMTTMCTWAATSSKGAQAKNKLELAENTATSALISKSRRKCFAVLLFVVIWPL